MNICVTGGAGSIGSEVVRHALASGHDVTAMDISEEGLWSLRAELPAVTVYPGDVTILGDVVNATKRADVVVHCAAMKHVDLCQINPYIAERVNVGGTQNVVCAARHDQRVVVVTSDKAIQPFSVMGESKQRAETIALGAGANVVRFGNVLGSRGSLVPVLKRFVRLGKPIPVTNPAMTRFLMLAREAVELIEQAWESPKRGQLFHPARLRSARIGEFIDACRDAIAPDHPIERVGMREGERLHEFMVYEGRIVRSDDSRFVMDREQIDTLLQCIGLCREVAA